MRREGSKVMVELGVGLLAAGALGYAVIVELGVGILAIGAVVYMIYWRRERMKWARIREEEMKRLERLKKIIEEGE